MLGKSWPWGLTLVLHQCLTLIRCNSVIGLRSFGADADTVVRLAGAFLKGMQAAGMPAVGKHFPGHGWVTADSHVAIPVDERSFAQINQADLQPFKRLQNNLAGMMPAHVIYSQVDSAPAGFSKVGCRTFTAKLHYQVCCLAMTCRWLVHMCR